MQNDLSNSRTKKRKCKHKQELSNYRLSTSPERCTHLARIACPVGHVARIMQPLFLFSWISGIPWKPYYSCLLLYWSQEIIPLVEVQGCYAFILDLPPFFKSFPDTEEATISWACFSSFKEKSVLEEIDVIVASLLDILLRTILEITSRPQSSGSSMRFQFQDVTVRTWDKCAGTKFCFCHFASSFLSNLGSHVALERGPGAVQTFATLLFSGATGLGALHQEAYCLTCIEHIIFSFNYLFYLRGRDTGSDEGSSFFRFIH